MSELVLSVISPRWSGIYEKATGKLMGFACKGCGKWHVDPKTHICLAVDDWHEQLCKEKKDE